MVASARNVAGDEASTMTTPAALDEFDVDESQPTVEYHGKMVRVMFDILIDIPYDQNEGRHNLVGVILEEEPYTKLYGEAFVTRTRLRAAESQASENHGTSEEKKVGAWEFHWSTTGAKG